MCCVEVIIVGHIWCRHYYFRCKYCRSNSTCKELSVKPSIVDLSDVGVIILELIGWPYTRSTVYKGHPIRDDIRILRDRMGHFISIFQVEWDSNIFRIFFQ